jgi:hypothetical protein
MGLGTTRNKGVYMILDDEIILCPSAQARGNGDDMLDFYHTCILNPSLGLLPTTLSHIHAGRLNHGLSSDPSFEKPREA